MRYIKKNGTELTRRTRHLDLAELIYGQVGGKLVAILNVQYGVGELEARNLAQNFYQELAGVYDDMKQRELSAQVGWIGVELLDGLTLSELDKARKLNYLYYCTLNGRKRDPLYLLEEAKCILGRIREGTRIEDEHVLYGAILSNMGAYYTTPFNKSYKKALKYHMEALKYRKEHSKEDCGNSYRTLMSDYFYLKDFQKAYEMMCAGLESETGYRRLSEILNVEQREEIEVPIDLLERGLGSEMRLLMDEKTSIELREEIQMEILCQIPYIYQESVKADEGRRRVDTRMLKSLYGKLEELNWGEFHEEWFEPMRKTVEEYRIKCKAIL